MNAAWSALAPFGGWSGPRNARLVVVGEAWGHHEAMMLMPFVGSAGKELWRMFGDAWGRDPEHTAAEAMHLYESAWVRQRGKWMEKHGVAFTNVFNLQPHNNKIEELCVSKDALPKDYDFPALSRALYLAPRHLPQVERLREELAECAPNLVVAVGNTACWALLRATNIGSIRGTISFSPWGHKVLPTYHPAGVLRQWGWRPIVVADLMKAQAEAAYPEQRRPRREVLINPERWELAPAMQRVLRDARESGFLSCDIETAGKMITCISFAGSPEFALTIPFAASARGVGDYWPERQDEIHAWRIVKDALESDIPKLGQNFQYDLSYLAPMGIRPRACIADTMLLHHGLFPEMQKGLGFLGSVYTNEPAWKLMRKGKADTEKRDE